MKTKILLILAIFACFSFCIVKQQIAKVSLGENKVETLKRLNQLNMQIERKVRRDAESAEVYLLPGDDLTLKKNNFEFTVTTQELPKTDMKGRGKRLAKRRPIETFPYNYYHNYVELEDFMRQIVAKYPAITRMYSIGRSVQGRELYVLDISKNVNNISEPEPKFKYVGNMHGDETVGREILINFIYYMASNYQVDPTITSLIDSTHISILPTMNPDGYELGRRTNARGFDLNRNFPDQFTGSVPAARQQPESSAVMAWSKSTPYVLSINFHGGDVCANYPYDGNREFINGRYTASPDDVVFRELALTYSRNHAFMSQSTSFANGITNGAEWYILYGGMQDWNYLNTNDFEITVELSLIKNPSPSTLVTEWNNNKKSLVEYLKFVHKGVKGIVRDQFGQSIQGALISVFDNTRGYGINHTVKSNAGGDYYRILAPGDYTVTASANGYGQLSQRVLVTSGNATVVNFQLNQIQRR